MLLGELRRAVGACQIVAQSKCKITGRHHVARRWVDFIQSSGGDEKSGMSAILHEGAEHDRGIEILGAIQKDSTKGNGFNKFGIKLEDPLSRFLLGPVLAEGDGMSNEGWVGVMKDGKDCIVAIGHGHHSFGWFGSRRKHRGMLECAKNVVAPDGEVPRLVGW